MIWATVSSRSCFCWLYSASPFLAAKDIINLILEFTIWWCPYIESSLVLLEEGICYDQCKQTLLAFVLLHSVLQGQICLLLQGFLDFLLLHPSLLWWKGHLFWALVLEGLISLHRTFNFSFFSITAQGIDRDSRDIEWFALETNRLFCRFWDCIKYSFRLFCWLWWLFHFF